MRPPRLLAWSAALALLLALALLPALARQPAMTRHRDDFSGPAPVWVRGEATARFTERQHVLTADQSHNAPPCETVRFEIDPNGFADYSYTTPPAPAAEDLTASVFVRAEGAGVQLLARLVLPHERDPQRLDQPLKTLVEGDRYAAPFAGRWQHLELSRAWTAIRQQRQLLRASLGHDVSLEWAYIDQLVLRLTGSGPGQVWIDDLEIGPVLDSRAPAPVAATPGGPVPAAAPRPSVEIVRGRLLVGGQPFFPRGVRHCGVDWGLLREAGFNTVMFEAGAAQTAINDAAGQGFFVVPTLTYRPAQAQSGDPFAVAADANALDDAELQRLGQEVSRFPAADAVLFWSLGGGHAMEQVAQVQRAALAVRRADPQRPITADVWDGLKAYSHNLDLLGVSRWPLYTSMELLAFRNWLTQRQQLAWSGSFIWTWVQAHRPDWYTKMLADPPPPPGVVEPVGPQPEQIRLLTYLSIATGCRGLGFWADSELGDPQAGQTTFLTLAALNQELQMLEPILLSLNSEPTWIATSNPYVWAAVLRSERGILVLPIWLGPGAQYVPGQAAAAQLKILVPQVPESMMAWEISPGKVRSFLPERITGGSRIILNDFDLTSAIVFTNDTRPNGLVAQWEDQARRFSQKAAYLTYQLALKQLAQVETVEKQLDPLAPVLHGAQDLVKDCRDRLDRARYAYDGQDYAVAYQEARHALRPLRHLMRLRWEQAVGTVQQKALDLPAASPYALSYYTLPRHWLLAREVQAATPGANVLEDGRFETGEQCRWKARQTTIDDMVTVARLVDRDAKEGSHSLMLAIEPKRTDKGEPLPAPQVLERTFLAADSPQVQLPPGTLVRVSAWIKMLDTARGTADGALFYDSAGGESLAVRINEPTRDRAGTTTIWKQYHLYRRVPASGTMFVTVALTGMGVVYFDDVRIEPLLPRQ